MIVNRSRRVFSLLVIASQRRGTMWRCKHSLKLEYKPVQLVAVDRRLGRGLSERHRGCKRVHNEESQVYAQA